MMTKIYDIISLNNHLYMVDPEFKSGDKALAASEKEHPTIFTVKNVTDKEVDGWNRAWYYPEVPMGVHHILASTDTTLGLPLIEDLDYEVWINLPGYEGRYLISNFGRFQSLDKKITTSTGDRVFKGKVISEASKGEYPSVNLDDGNGSKKLTIHSLLAKTFIPNPENLPEVNHKDGDKFNYKLKNLEWSSKRENQCHGKKLRATSSKYSGVVFDKNLGKWQARITVNGKRQYLGVFNDESLASAAYSKALEENGIKNKYL